MSLISGLNMKISDTLMVLIFFFGNLYFSAITITQTCNGSERQAEGEIWARSKLRVQVLNILDMMIPYYNSSRILSYGDTIDPQFFETPMMRTFVKLLYLFLNGLLNASGPHL
jgi:hypothetical protein